jgi:hypothetical protein
VNPRDRSGSTPLSVTAEEAGRAAAAAALLEAGADVRAKNAAGEAPLYIASLRGHLAMVQLLLQYHEQESISWMVSCTCLPVPMLTVFEHVQCQRRFLQSGLRPRCVGLAAL